MSTLSGVRRRMGNVAIDGSLSLMWLALDDRKVF
jgi:hypothetical protein